MRTTRLADGLASVFLEGAWSVCALAKRARRLLGVDARWPIRMARRVVARFAATPRDAFSELSAFIARDPSLRRAESHGLLSRARFHFRATDVAMAPRNEAWRLPRLDTVGDVARWLGLDIPDLAWFADLAGHARKPRSAKLDHYVACWMPKRSGGSRLVEAPKRWLKELQQRVLRELIDRIPPHEAAHGFVRGRSATTHAAMHVGKQVVLRIDLEDFFASVPAARAIAVFRAVGYTRSVARVLAGLCTTYANAPMPPLVDDVAQRWRSARRYAARHLPQGAPTSPGLANLCAYALDVRLAAACAKMGATYTRYADDLVFSSNGRLDRFAPVVAAIAQSEGFTVNHRKTRLMRASVRQEVTGLVVNPSSASVVRVPRHELERLEAILFNCVRSGPETQNRAKHPDFRAHLAGKLAWVRGVSAHQARPLDELFAQIDWPT